MPFQRLCNVRKSWCKRMKRSYTHGSNRPLPSSWNPQFQHEAKCKPFLVKMSFIRIRMKYYFHIKGWASLRSKRFRAVSRVKDRAKNGSRFISRAAKTENLIPRPSLCVTFYWVLKQSLDSPSIWLGELCRSRRLLLAEPDVCILARSCFRGRFYNEGPTMVRLKIKRQIKECAWYQYSYFN